jgi:uncharacterized protein (DUF1778 family)
MRADSEVNKKGHISDRIGMRLSSELKQKIQTAAQIKGVPVAGFVKAVLDEAADLAIKQHEFIKLTLRDRETFVKALLNPGEPSKRAIAAAKRYKQQLGL